MTWPLHPLPLSHFIYWAVHAAQASQASTLCPRHTCCLRAFAWLFSAWILLSRYPAGWCPRHFQIISQISPSPQGLPERCCLIRKRPNYPNAPHPVPGTHNPLLCFNFFLQRIYHPAHHTMDLFTGQSPQEQGLLLYSLMYPKPLAHLWHPTLAHCAGRWELSSA